MMRLIKKYQNRRLYDTETSQYVNVDTLRQYVLDGLLFKIEDSETGKDLTATVLLQILVEMESGPSQFLSVPMLRQIITLASHPMHTALKTMMEQMVDAMQKPLEMNPYQQASETWNKQIQQIMTQWQGLFKG